MLCQRWWVLAGSTTGLLGRERAENIKPPSAILGSVDRFVMAFERVGNFFRGTWDGWTRE